MTGDRDALMGTALQQLEGLMSVQRRAFCSHLPQREVSLPQLHVLMVLQQDGPMTVSELAQLLHVSAPSASALLDRMEERSLVQRVRDLTDRRVVHVEMSEHGRSVVEELTWLKQDQLQRLLGAMTEDELRDLIGGVAAVRAALSRVDKARESAAQAAS
jgi:DNA-binding MarR family transcriptional regulator